MLFRLSFPGAILSECYLPFSCRIIENIWADQPNSIIQCVRTCSYLFVSVRYVDGNNDLMTLVRHAGKLLYDDLCVCVCSLLVLSFCVASSWQDFKTCSQVHGGLLQRSFQDIVLSALHL